MWRCRWCSWGHGAAAGSLHGAGRSWQSPLMPTVWHRPATTADLSEWLCGPGHGHLFDPDDGDPGVDATAARIALAQLGCAARLCGGGRAVDDQLRPAVWTTAGDTGAGAEYQHAGCRL